MNAFQLPDDTRVSQVHLRVRDIRTVADFYEHVLGLAVLSNEKQRIAFCAPGQSEPLVVFSEDPQALPHPRRALGLFHLAIRFPSRAELANAVRRLIQHNYPIEGASDHLVSEAVYLSDPAGNGVELYADVPREKWGWRDGQVLMATEALDLHGLLAEAEEPTPSQAPPGTDIGHIHLHVADLAQAERFFHDFLGMSVTQRSYPGALFFSAGGYHHHIGANTWAGKTVPPEGSEGLFSYRIELPLVSQVDVLHERTTAFGLNTNAPASGETPHQFSVQDPSGAWLEISAAKKSTPSQ